MGRKNTLILSGLGLNCEDETAFSCQKSGADKVDVIHMLKFLKGEVKLHDYDFIVFIGGFLDGDYLGSARVAVNRIKYNDPELFDFRAELKEFISKKKIILGICNGFQLLVKLGILPFQDLDFSEQSVSLTNNDNGKFEDRWVQVKVNEQCNSVFTKGLKNMYLPVRHGEGKIVVKEEVKDRIVQDNLICMQYANDEGNVTSDYPHNPNGSWNNVAALSNQSGTIMGLMPHPEAYNHYTNHPHWTRLKFREEDGEGLLLFKNAYQYLSEI